MAGTGGTRNDKERRIVRMQKSGEGEGAGRVEVHNNVTQEYRGPFELSRQPEEWDNPLNLKTLEGKLDENRSKRA